MTLFSDLGTLGTAALIWWPRWNRILNTCSATHWCRTPHTPHCWKATGEGCTWQ